MQKPVGYDETIVGGSFTPIEPGGHYLTILGAKETDMKGYPVLVVQFDTSGQDKQPNFYQDMYRSNQERFADVRYQGQHNIFLPTGDPQDDKYKWSTKALKGFITAVEASNQGFKYQWGTDVNVFKGKQVGGVFGVEEYNDKTTGDLKRITKLRYFVSVDEVETAEVPKVKEAKPSYNDHIARAQQQDSHDGFFSAPEDNTALPFDL